MKTNIEIYNNRRTGIKTGVKNAVNVMHTVIKISNKNTEKYKVITTLGEETLAEFETPEFAYIFCSWLNGSDHPNKQIDSSGAYDEHHMIDFAEIANKMDRFWNEYNRLNH